MTKRFGSALAFKTSLESHLKQEADRHGVHINLLRQRLVMERMLARLFAQTHPPWVLKGGFALDLRYRPRARTTRDIDLTVSDDLPSTVEQRLDAVRAELQTAAANDLGDYLQYAVGSPEAITTGAPLGGGRFPVEVTLAGKLYERFHIDVGFGDPVTGPPDVLTGDDFLSFIDVRPARVLAVSRAQQFAEKLHAYTIPWRDRINTRTKDLVDLLLLIKNGLPPDEWVRSALRDTFRLRKAHSLPSAIPPPPAAWETEFASLASQAGLLTQSLDAAFAVLNGFWTKLGMNGAIAPT